jgi:hypothetical protein
MKMRILFILLGLIIAISSITLLGVMICLILTDWPLLYFEKILFLINIIALAIFVITLTIIPHGKIDAVNEEHRR